MHCGVTLLPTAASCTHLPDNAMVERETRSGGEQKQGWAAERLSFARCCALIDGNGIGRALCVGEVRRHSCSPCTAAANQAVFVNLRTSSLMVKRCSGANFLLTYFSWQGYSNP
jgi:hypothetical protein